MEKKLSKFVFAVLFLSLPAVSFGQLITIAITANVTGVNDSYNLLEGKVSVGNTITGTYTYDTSTPDTNPLQTLGDYNYHSLPCGLVFAVGELVFSTDSEDIGFFVGIANNHSEPPWDGYWINSYNNSLLSNGTEVDRILWQLDDYGGTALSSATLPTVAPVLSDWDYSTLSIVGGNGIPCDKTFSIGANVISAVLVPEPMSVLLFGFGLLALRRTKIN